ncbi:MAG: recombination mediator RecR [Patescibacteria group bacterium]
MIFSPPLTDLIEIFHQLPGIGPRTARKLAFHLLAAPASFLENFSDVLLNLKSQTGFCPECFNLSKGSGDLCAICADKKRNSQIICVVENIFDLMALERGSKYEGVYHVLGGVIDPLNNIHFEDLRVKELLARSSKAKEIIFAISSTTEGETTVIRLSQKLRENGYAGVISKTAVGIPMGGTVEYADSLTLTQALAGRRKIDEK